MRYRIEKRKDGKWHVFVIGEELTVWWETYAEALDYLRNRIQCDADDRAGEGEFYSTIRRYIGNMIGMKILDITQHDEDDYQETGQAFVMLLLEDGRWLKFVEPEKIQYSHRGEERAIVLEGREDLDGLPEAE